MGTSYNLEHGVMPQIQALINPLPWNQDISSTTRPDYRYQFYLRFLPRGVNHDACDSCEENGDLVCCDTCAAAFHLECTDPPLTTEDIEKLMTWSCNACRYKKLQQQPGCSKSIIKTEPSDKPGSGLISVFSQLIDDAKQNNPKEFKLPPVFGCVEAALPGTSRLVFKKSCPSRARQTIIEMDNFLVPSPATICHFCNKTCRSGALIKCDLCPKFYHLDCLTPPLTVPPTTIWQCPLHPESTLESKLKTTSLSERVRIRDYTSESICGYDVQRDFIRKARRNFDGDRPHIRKTLAAPADNIEKPIAETYNYTDRPACYIIDAVPKAVAERYNFIKTSTEASAEQKENNQDNENEMEWTSTADCCDEDFNQLLVLANAATTIENIASGVQDPLEPGFDERKMIDRLDIATVKFLAAEGLKSIQAKRIAEGKTGAILVKEKENSGLLLHETTPTKLMLVCLNNGKGYKFNKTLIEIGLGSQVDINLVESHCKNISKKHATIFHDSITNKWELLCYSTYGIMVNRCLYGCSPQDEGSGSVWEEKAKKLFADAVGARKAELLQQARLSGAAKHKSPLKVDGAKDCECSRSGIWSGPCSEEPVEIKAKDLIQIGCLKFVVMSALLNEIHIN